MSVAKGNWYKLLLDKVDKALKEGFYFEAIFIEYMIIDDRVKSLCKLAGIPLETPNKGKPKMLGTLEQELKNTKLNPPSGKWNLFNIPIDIMPNDEIIQIVQNDYPEADVYNCYHAPKKLINYEKDSNGQIESLYLGHNSNFFEEFDVWKNKRNHWMHNAGDDNWTEEEYKEVIIPLAIDGASFCREICDITTKIKRSLK